MGGKGNGKVLVQLRHRVRDLYQWLAALLWGFKKWLLRFLTGQHEVERLCVRWDPSKNPGELCVSLENALIHSTSLKSMMLHEMGPDCDIPAMIDTIVRFKKISSDKNRKVVLRRLKFALERIKDLHELKLATEQKLERFDATNKQHEDLLWTLWDCMRPGVERPERKSKEWTELGFQGHDPATDFRGMGVLGLENLVRGWQQHESVLRAVYQDSLEHKNWFSFAITGIHITNDLFTFLKAQREDKQLSIARHYFYQYGATMKCFVQLYALCFAQLNARWKKENPPNVMSWGPIHDAHVKAIRQFLVNRTYMENQSSSSTSTKDKTD